jgi:phosphoglucosamine mutase
MKEHGLLKQDTLVVTVMSNLGLKLFLKENGIRYAETAVGDRYVLEEMRKSGYNLGGEQSGHVIALNRNTTGDGVMTALLLLNVVKKEGKSLSELADMIPILPQILVNVRLPKEVEYDLKGDRELWDRVAAIEKEMEGRGRVLIRKSGTEPLIRIMIEGEDQEDIDAKAHELADIISVKTK